MPRMTAGKSVQEAGALLFKLVRALGVVENDEVRCCGVTTAQGLALLAMNGTGQVTMREVAEALGVSPGTATRVIDNLVRDGLVGRAPSARDRRKVCVRPTRGGREVIRELDRCYGRFWRSVFQDVPKARLPAILDVLHLLVEGAEKARKVCPAGG
ncbi:MAG TPA: MarR family transcriptional regulator [Phycisphaerae bacterium]|nr:MarR family transcriptional regulator [Phycisphaerae bacterium]